MERDEWFGGSFTFSVFQWRPSLLTMGKKKISTEKRGIDGEQVLPNYSSFFPTLHNFSVLWIFLIHFWLEKSFCWFLLQHRKENEGIWSFKNKACYLKNSGELWCQGLTVIFQQKNVSDHHSFSFLEHRRFYRNKLSARTQMMLHTSSFFFFFFFFHFLLSKIYVFSYLQCVKAHPAHCTMLIHLNSFIVLRFPSSWATSN